MISDEGKNERDPLKLFDNFYVHFGALQDRISEDMVKSFVEEDLLDKINYMKNFEPSCISILYGNGIYYYTPSIGDFIVSKSKEELHAFFEPQFAINLAGEFYGRLNDKLNDSFH